MSDTGAKDLGAKDSGAKDEPLRPPPLEFSRVFKAPPARVFAMWSSAEHVKRWFSPECFTTPEAEIDFRVGGKSDVCMRSPTGEDFWSRGEYVEIVENERIVTRSYVEIGGERKFMAVNTVTFAPEGDGTRLHVRQEYEIYDLAFAGAVEGASVGWRQTLDKLERELAVV